RRDHPYRFHDIGTGAAEPVRQRARETDGVPCVEDVGLAVDVHFVGSLQYHADLLARVSRRVTLRRVPGLRLDPDDLQRPVQVGGEQLVDRIDRISGVDLQLPALIMTYDRRRRARVTLLQ